MKITTDDKANALYLKFNYNKIVRTIQLELEMNVDIDIDDKVVGLEVLHYFTIKRWGNDLLKENNLSLNEDSIVFYSHQGYNIAWFDMRDVKEEYTVCKIYIEEESIQYDLVQNFIQDEVDFIVRRRNTVDSKYNNVISDNTTLYYK